MKKKTTRKTTKKKYKAKLQKREIKYHLINSGLAGMLVFLGSLTSGSGVTVQGVSAGFLAGVVLGLSKFKEYWTTQKKEYVYNYLFTFY